MLRRLFRYNNRAPGSVGRKTSFFAAFLAGALILSGCGLVTDRTVLADEAKPDAATAQPSPVTDNPPSAAAAKQPSAIQIPMGTTLSVRLLSTISSCSAQAGEEVNAELAAPVVVDGQTIFDKRANVRIRVLAAEASGRRHHPGYLRITVAAIQDPNGKWDPVSAIAISARGNSHENGNVTLIEGATAVGATIGAIADGGKGAAIGAASGAGAGTAGAYIAGKKEVTISVGRVLRFRTTSEITVNH